MERRSIRWIQAPASSRGSSMVVVDLSPVDLEMPDCYMSMVLSFTGAPQGAESELEQGLSTALFHYPEFAGRLGTSADGKSCIHLDNAGVPFLNVECTQEMLPYLEQHGNNIDELLASHSSLVDLSVPLLVQLTRFRCGGLTLGIDRHHHIADGTASSQFLLDWSSCTRIGIPAVLQAPLVHDRSIMMPREPAQLEFDRPQYAASTPRGISEEAITTVRKHFSVAELARIKADAGGRYSTFVSLAAHLWRTMTKLIASKPETQSVCTFPIDGRRALSAGPAFFGNAVFIGKALSTAQELLESPLQSIADLLYTSLKKVSTEEYMRSEIDFLALKQKTQAKVIKKGTCLYPHIAISSWTRFPLFDIDFGFGAPTSLATAGLKVLGLLVMAPASERDGSLDVFFNVTEEQSKALDCLL